MPSPSPRGGLTGRDQGLRVRAGGAENLAWDRGERLLRARAPRGGRGAYPLLEGGHRLLDEGRGDASGGGDDAADEDGQNVDDLEAGAPDLDLPDDPAYGQSVRLPPASLPALGFHSSGVSRLVAPDRFDAQHVLITEDDALRLLEHLQVSPP